MASGTGPYAIRNSPQCPTRPRQGSYSCRVSVGLAVTTTRSILPPADPDREQRNRTRPAWTGQSYPDWGSGPWTQGGPSKKQIRPWNQEHTTETSRPSASGTVDMESSLYAESPVSMARGDRIRSLSFPVPHSPPPTSGVQSCYCRGAPIPSSLLFVMLCNAVCAPARRLPGWLRYHIWCLVVAIIFV